MTHYAKPVSDLLTLNEFAMDDWLDYSSMGINENHRETLLVIESLLNAEAHLYWAPRHAIPLGINDRSSNRQYPTTWKM